MPLDQWQDWKWQLKNSLKSETDFAKVYSLSESERQGFLKTSKVFSIRSTPYYATLGDPLLPEDPLRLIQTPDFKETASHYQEMEDPLGENKNSVNRRLVHRYADRVLFLVTDFCSVYCRYCTRKRFTGQDQAFIGSKDYEASLEYIRSRQGLREVILSGGDPLTLSDDRIEKILSDLRKIEHIEVIRIGSRMPTVNPFRITQDLVQILKKYKPVFFMAHFNHPREITMEAALSIERLVDNGVPVMNQMVLLNGINNHPAIVQALSRRLLYLRAKPYYMFQCDPSMGTDHLRTSILDSQAIQKELWGHLSGLAMPTFAVDIPKGGGKVVYTPNFEIGAVNKVDPFSKRQYRGWDGVEAEYVNPPTEKIVKPLDYEVYVEELERLKSAKS